MCSSQVSPLSQSGSMAARPCPSGLTGVGGLVGCGLESYGSRTAPDGNR